MKRHQMKVSAMQLMYSTVLSCLLLLQSAAHAFMETPKFRQLRLLYPGYRHHGGQYTNADVIKLVLGQTGNTTRSRDLHGGAAALRLSWTLNRYGGRHAIGREPVHLGGHGTDSFSGADGQQYIYSTDAFGPFLAARYGDPIVQRTTVEEETRDTRRRRRRRRSWSLLAGRQGIARVVGYMGGRQHSHIGLWDCDRFYESRDWSLDSHLVTVEFWEAADSFCPPPFHSHASSKPRLQTLQPSVQVVARHNLAAQNYLNDESQHRRSRRLHDKLWLQ